MVGFLPLLNGLLSRADNAIDHEAADPHVRTTIAAALPQAAGRPQATTRKEKGDTNTKTVDTSFQGTLFRPLFPETIVATPPPIEMSHLPSRGSVGHGTPNPAVSQVQGSSALTQSQSVALPSAGATNSLIDAPSPASGTTKQSRDIAFALRLSWQPAGANIDAIATNRAQFDTALPGAADSRNSIGGGSQPNQPEVKKEIFSRFDSASTEKVEISTSDPAALRPTVLPEGDRPVQSSSPFQSIPGRLLNAATVAQGTELRSPKIAERIQPERLHASCVSRDQDQVSEPIPVQEGDAQPPNAIRDRASIPRQVPALSSPEICSPIADGTTSKAAAEASLSACSVQPEGRVTQPSMPRSSPVAPSGNSAPAPNYSGNATGQDMANSESDGKAPRLPLAEKAPQIPNANQQPSGQGVPGVCLSRIAEPNGAPQTQAQTKPAATELPPAPQDSPGREATASQPIREISFRLAAASTNVDIQVAQRAGKVQVAVRTSDQELSESLQANLGDLVGRLQDKGFRTETWTPVTAQHGSAAASEPSQSGHNDSPAGDSGWGGGQQQQQQRHPEQEPNQPQPRRWKTQLEESLSASSAGTQEKEKP